MTYQQGQELQSHANQTAIGIFARAEANNKRYKEHAALYRKRQQINEPIFGTVKRQWNYYYTHLRGLKKVNEEHSLIMSVYNIKRTINIL